MKALLALFLSLGLCWAKIVQNYEPLPHVVVYPVYGKPTTTSKPTTTTTVMPTTMKPYPRYSELKLDAAAVLSKTTFECGDKIEGYFADTFFGCRFFHQCHYFVEDDISYIQHAVYECGQGTKFNQTTRTCDYSADVNCDPATVEAIIDEQIRSPMVTGHSKARPLPKTNFKCTPDNHPNGFYIADEEAGCSIYHRCVYRMEGGTKIAEQYSFFCPEGTSFNQATISCMDSSEVNCHQSKFLIRDQSYLHPHY